MISSSTFNKFLRDNMPLAMPYMPTRNSYAADKTTGVRSKNKARGFVDTDGREMTFAHSVMSVRDGYPIRELYKSNIV